MKISFRSILAVVVALCTFQLLAHPERSATGVKANTGNSQSAEDSLEQQIVSKEHEGVDALKAGNVELFGSLLADDAVLVDSRGPATKAQVLQNVAGFRISEYSMEDVRFVLVSDKSGLITYKFTESGTSHGKEFSATVYVSTLYAQRGGKWVSLFSQETAAAK
jgi:Domain of unknown function (DUF4440)